MDTVQRRTFLYFWEGAEPNSGLAPERYHVDGVYPQNDANVVTSGGSGFGIMAILAGIDRGYVTREEGLARMERIVSFLEKADRFHGAYPHWWYGDTGKVKPFGQKDNGGDLVETAFLMQGLLAVHQYYINGNEKEKALAARIDQYGKTLTGTGTATVTKMYYTGTGAPPMAGNGLPHTWIQRMYDYVYPRRSLSYPRSTGSRLSRWLGAERSYRLPA